MTNRHSPRHARSSGKIVAQREGPTLRRLIAAVVSLLALVIGGFAGLTVVSSPPASAVINGTTPTTAPSWFVYLEWKTKKETGICSGALVSPQWVLTAGHCLVNEAGTVAKATEVTVWVGYKSSKSKGTRRGVSSIVRNGYSDHGQYIQNDVGLLKLDKSISSANAAIPVAPSRAAYEDDLPVVLWGAGRTQPLGSLFGGAGTLHTTRPREWSLAPGCDLASFDIICFRYDPNATSLGASGDSGGPWVATVDGAPVLMAPFTGYVDETGETYAYGTAAGYAATVGWLRATAGIPQIAPGNIVRDPATAQAWLVGSDGYRRSIPDGGTYLCLTGRGATVNNLPRAQINLIPLRTQNATCGADANALLFGTYNSSELDWVASVLSAAGYNPTVEYSDVLPDHISQYSQVWHVSIEPLSAADRDRLVIFAKNGGGVYLTGERPCCETINASTADIINKLIVSVGGIQVGGLGDPSDDTAPLPLNPSAVGGLTTQPFSVRTWQPSAPGGMGNVSGDNVVSTSTQGTFDPDATVVAAAWGSTEVVGGGRLAVFMDVNWLEAPYRDEATAPLLVQNLALFLSGLAAPPNPPAAMGAALPAEGTSKSGLPVDRSGHLLTSKGTAAR